MSVLMNTCDVLIITTVLGFAALATVDAVTRLVNSAKPTIKAYAEASVTPKPQPKAPATQPKPQPKPQPKATVSDVIRTEAKFRSVGSAAVDYSAMSVRELRALCQADPIKFKGYSPYVKRGKVALIRFMQSR